MTGSSRNRLPCTAASPPPTPRRAFTATAAIRCAKRHVDSVSLSCAACARNRGCRTWSAGLTQVTLLSAAVHCRQPAATAPPHSKCHGCHTLRKTGALAASRSSALPARGMGDVSLSQQILLCRVWLTAYHVQPPTRRRRTTAQSMPTAAVRCAKPHAFSILLSRTAC